MMRKEKNRQPVFLLPGRVFLKWRGRGVETRGVNSRTFDLPTARPRYYLIEWNGRKNMHEESFCGGVGTIIGNSREHLEKFVKITGDKIHQRPQGHTYIEFECRCRLNPSKVLKQLPYNKWVTKCAFQNSLSDLTFISLFSVGAFQICWQLGNGCYRRE